MTTSASHLGGGAAEHAPLNALAATPEQLARLKTLDHEGPIVMLNLLLYRGVDGAAAYEEYAAAMSPLLRSIDAKVLFWGDATVCLIGNASWDAVGLVEYPNKEVFLTMLESEEYRALLGLRERGLEGQILYSVAQRRSRSTDKR